MKLSRNHDKKITQVCQAKNSGRNQQICETVYIQEDDDLETTGKTTMVMK